MADVERSLDENGYMVYTIKTEKMIKDIVICKAVGNPPSYMVHIDGRVPKALEGRFTHPDRALPLVLEYIRLKPESRTVKRDQNTKRREDQKKKLQEEKDRDAASKPNSSEQLHSGSTD